MFFKFLPLLLLLLAACASQPGKAPDTSLPRAAPSYLHWLQKQSMLHAAPAIIAEVSQSGRVWLQNSGAARINVLLEAAPNWLLAAGTRPPVFRNLMGELPGLVKDGINGIYLGQTGEKPDIWLNASAPAPTANPASMQFDAAFGGNEDFDELASAAERAGIQLGSALLAAATGRGPDFVLQARNAQSHAGLYAMLAAPEDALPFIPPDKQQEQWDARPLPAQTVAALAEKGILPPRLARDALPWASPGGWAATGGIVGADGVSRRWLYRYAETPAQPVLAWQDPSGLAARLFSAAVIRQTGLQGQSLAGIRIEPLMGLEPAGQGIAPDLSPGIDALNEISRQIHRYGGWAMQADAAPSSVIEAVLRGPCDFCRDDVTPALTVFGLLAADGRPVAHLLRGWISRNVDFSRLARGLGDNGDPVSAMDLNTQNVARILADTPEFAEPAARLRQAGALTPQRLSSIVKKGRGGDAENLRRFLLAWRIGMPGLAFLTLPAQNESWLVNSLAARKQSGLAAGSALRVIRGHGGGFGILSSLPQGGYWLLACNFGVNPDELAIELPGNAAAAVDVASGAHVGQILHGRDFHMPLDGRAAINVLFRPDK